MIDPKLAADEAARKIVDAFYLEMAPMSAQQQSDLIKLVTPIVLTAITRCAVAPTQGLNDK